MQGNLDNSFYWRMLLFCFQLNIICVYLPSLTESNLNKPIIILLVLYSLGVFFVFIAILVKNLSEANVMEWL